LPGGYKFSTISQKQHRIGVAIGDEILDLSSIAQFYPVNVRVSRAKSFQRLRRHPLLNYGNLQTALQDDKLNALMELGCEAWDVVRTKTTELLLEDSELHRNDALRQRLVVQSLD
jgi:fumarylacetoacetase